MLLLLEILLASRTSPNSHSTLQDDTLAAKQEWLGCNMVFNQECFKIIYSGIQPIFLCVHAPCKVDIPRCDGKPVWRPTQSSFTHIHQRWPAVLFTFTWVLVSFPAHKHKQRHHNSSPSSACPSMNMYSRLLSNYVKRWFMARGSHA